MTSQQQQAQPQQQDGYQRDNPFLPQQAQPQPNNIPSIQIQSTNSNNMLTQQNSSPVQTYVKPAPVITAGYTEPKPSSLADDNNTNIAKLNNYMEYQKLAPVAEVDHNNNNNNNNNNKLNENTGIWSKPRKSSDVDSPDNKDESE